MGLCMFLAILTLGLVVASLHCGLYLLALLAGFLGGNG